MLEIKNLTKEYAGKTKSIVALENVSLSIKESEFVSVIGPSGCGKSTLLKLIAGLEAPTSGKILFHGSETKRSGMKIGFVFQNYSLFPWLTVYENIAFGLRLKSLSENEIDAIVCRYLKVIGLEHFKYAYPKSLSGGMQQRVAVARTLATDPDIILMDEPFGALDMQTRSQMQDFLIEILKGTKQTVIMVTHDIEEAFYLSDRIVALLGKPGVVKDTITVPFPRTHQEIRSAQKLSQVYGLELY